MLKKTNKENPQNFNNVSSSSNCMVKSENIARQGLDCLLLSSQKLEPQGCGHPGIRELPPPKLYLRKLRGTKGS